MGDEYIHLYLDFNEKLTPNIFEKELFLRVANLHKRSPLVQLNDLVFKGSYDECVGTNLFFEEIEDPPLKTNIYEKVTPIRLEHLLAQTKILKLKQMKLPNTTWSPTDIAPKINLNQNYQKMLDKLEQGALNIEDLVLNDNDMDACNALKDSTETADNVETMPLESESVIENYIECAKDQTPTKILDSKYDRLKRLARRPVKRMTAPELVEECEPKYKDAFEYHNLKQQVLQPSDAFYSVTTPILEHNLMGGVDMDRCLLQGLIKNSNKNGTLTEDERNKVLNLDNLKNLSLPARYLVLRESVSKIEQLIPSTPREELEQVDESGKTVEDIYRILKDLVSALEGRIHQPAAARGRTAEDKLRIKSEKVIVSDMEYYTKYRHHPSEDLVRGGPQNTASNQVNDNSSEIGLEDEGSNADDSFSNTSN